MRSAGCASLAIIISFFSLGCEAVADGSSGTTGRAIVLKTRVEIQEGLSQPQPNALGWEVSLSKAYISVGPLYYYSGDPVLSLRTRKAPVPRTIGARLSDLLVPPAQAHPGHYIAGVAKGQMLSPTTIDLLGGAVQLADGAGLTGDTNSADFTWQSPPQGPHADVLQDHVILTQGTATRGAVSLQFLAKADAGEVLDGDGKLGVAGCAFGASPGAVGINLESDGTVTLSLAPRVWFDQVDFAYVVPGTPGAPVPRADGVIDISGTLTAQGFLRGVKKGTAYQFSYSK